MSCVNFFACVMSEILASIFLCVAALVFLASLDDLLIDLLCHVVFRSRIAEWNPDQNARTPLIAVFVANWHEADVLADMVEKNLSRQTYKRFRIVLGVYPNDKATIAVARELARRHPDVVQVVVNRKDGPTSKGQMLNEMFFQQFSDLRNAPDLCVLHDSEDVIDPLSFAVFAAESDLHAMIQIPVFSLDSRRRSLVAATYMEEFAERHTCEMLLRQKLGAFVPSAGVGTCLRADLIQHFVRRRGHVLQNGCVTEDYILGAEAHNAGFSTSFAAYRDPATRRVIATMEYFPKTLWASIKQRTRWTYGIGFEGTLTIGWVGSFWNRFFLFRDRKGVIANFLPIVSFGLLLCCLYAAPNFAILPPPAQAVAWLIFSVNSISIVIRLGSKAAALRRVYGFYDLIGVTARWPVSIFINMVAAARAWQSFLIESRLGSSAIRWAKTQHELPTEFTSLVPIPVIAASGRGRVARRAGAVAALCNVALVTLSAAHFYLVTDNERRQRLELRDAAFEAIAAAQVAEKTLLSKAEDLPTEPLDQWSVEMASTGTSTDDDFLAAAGASIAESVREDEGWLDETWAVAAQDPVEEFLAVDGSPPTVVATERVPLEPRDLAVKDAIASLDLAARTDSDDISSSGSAARQYLQELRPIPVSESIVALNSRDEPRLRARATLRRAQKRLSSTATAPPSIKSRVAKKRLANLNAPKTSPAILLVEGAKNYAGRSTSFLRRGCANCMNTASQF